MAPRCRSSGVATLLAITSGLAPGSEAETKMAGASILRQRRHRQQLNAAPPANATPSVNRVVATGRAMNGRGEVHALAARRALGASRSNAR